MSAVIAERIPVAAELFEWSDTGAALIGSRCAGCGTHYFPKALSCRNPQCGDKRLQATAFGRRGRLYSWTVQAYQPPPLFGMDPWEPYALGLVELPEGLRVLGLLTGCPVEELRIDMELELVVEPLYVDQDGREVLTYKYRPAVPS